MIESELNRVIIDEQGDQQIIILKERDGERAFPIVIGIFEAAAIDRKLRGIEHPRPLTHDLLARVIEGLNCRLERVVVSDLSDNTFYATLHLEGREGTTQIDARPSDAIALAVRTGAPIYVEEKVFDRACF